MTGLSGIGMLARYVVNLYHTLTRCAACVFGASFICVDIIVRQFPGKRGWKIQNSDTFLSISLSLSFGVMVRAHSLQ